MNVRTLVILSLIIALIIYFINKKWIKIESVCFEDDKVASVVLKKGIINPARISLKTGESKSGYSLLEVSSKVILTVPGKNKKVFQSIDYYQKNNIDPTL